MRSSSKITVNHHPHCLPRVLFEVNLHVFQERETVTKPEHQFGGELKMHLFSRFGPRATTALLLLATQGVSQSVPSPNLDFSDLGQVALTGDFDAIQVYSFTGQQQGFSNNGSTSLLSHLADGAYEALAYTDGSIQAICPFVLTDGTFEGMVVGGNFTSIGGVASRSVALFNTTSRQIVALPGIEGQVSALMCDQETQTVYVGGTFEAAGSSNAIAWIAAGAWANLPFEGFDAPVTSITKAPNGHIVFGGSFTGLGNLTSSRNISDRASQPINLGSAKIESSGDTTRAGFGNASSVLCPSNTSDGSSTWLLRDDAPGSFTARFRFGFQPTKIRLWNTNFEGRGTKTWRFTAIPIGGILNLTYIDPETGDRAYCDARCTLARNTSTGYQDFFLTDPNVGMDAFTIDISDWYGKGAGLDGIQIFQTDIFAYAIQDFNAPACPGTPVSASATTAGGWYSTPSRSSVADYLTVVTGPTSVEETEIVFEPEIQEAGNYSVIVYTPGCMQDSSCSARAFVNVTGALTSQGERSFITQLSQTNNFDKYDQVYQGRIEATTDSFRPQVTIRASGSLTDQLMVASRIRFGYISSSGGLNGLFDYDPNKAVVDMDFSKSAINNAGTMLQPDAKILTLATNDDTIYAAGRFSDDTFTNIMAFSNNNATSLPGGGLNAAVRSMYSMDDFLYVGGNFTGTNTGDNIPLNNAAAYQYSTKQWVALGTGLNGPVDYVIPVAMNMTSSKTEIMIAFTGRFSQIQASGSDPAIAVQDLALWSPSGNNWLQHVPGTTMQLLSGKVTAASFLPNNTWLGAGTLASLGQAISGVVGASENEGSVTLQRLPIDISQSDTQQRPLRKRALSGERNVTGVVTGTYDQSDGRNLSIFGGHFSATSSNGSTVSNLLFSHGSDSEAVTGLPSGIDSNSTFLALTVQSGILFAGGSITGSVSDSQINGLVLYDLASASFRSVQPAALVGDNVVVNAIAAQPGTSGVYVGGSFDRTTQGLSCSSVCMYDISTTQWNTAGSGLEGEVKTLYWNDNNRLIAAGDLALSGNAVSLAIYDAGQQTWSPIPVSGIPKGVTAFAPATTKADQMWVAGTATNGSAFVVMIDDKDALPVRGLLNSGTTIRGLQLMSLSKSHGQTQYLGRKDALLLTGQLNLTNFGMASAALFNGTAMTPLILSSKADGSAGSISQLLTSQANDRGSSRKSGLPLLWTKLTRCRRRSFNRHRCACRSLRSTRNNIPYHLDRPPAESHTTATFWLQHDSKCSIR